MLEIKEIKLEEVLNLKPVKTLLFIIMLISCGFAYYFGLNKQLFLTILFSAISFISAIFSILIYLKEKSDRDERRKG